MNFIGKCLFLAGFLGIAPAGANAKSPVKEALSPPKPPPVIQNPQTKPALSPVCDRSAEIKDLITALSGKTDCQKINMEDLKKIEVIDLSNKAVKSLKAGDFSGLSGLYSLNLSENPISALPEGLFVGSGLTNLNFIYLAETQLESLPEGWLPETDLPALRALYLSGNRIKTVSELAFSHPGLTHIYLYGNPLTQETKNKLGKQLGDKVFFEN